MHLYASFVICFVEKIKKEEVPERKEKGKEVKNLVDLIGQEIETHQLCCVIPYAH